MWLNRSYRFGAHSSYNIHTHAACFAGFSPTQRSSVSCVCIYVCTLSFCVVCVYICVSSPFFLCCVCVYMCDFIFYETDGGFGGFVGEAESSLSASFSGSSSGGLLLLLGSSESFVEEEAIL
jgi:hypothetical protein